MKLSGKSLSVILLMFNEQENIGPVLRDTVRFLSDALEDWEIIVVDDGSTDDSEQVVRPFCAENPRIRLVSHPENRGMGAGMRTGIRAASKQFFVFNAADGQVEPSQLGRMIPLLETSDIVLTKYGGGRETSSRGVLSWLFRAYMRTVAGIDFTMEGLYLFPTSRAAALEPIIEADTFFFSFELIKRGIVQMSLTTAVTEIECRPRMSGVSKVANVGRTLKVARDVAVFGLSRWPGL